VKQKVSVAFATRTSSWIGGLRSTIITVLIAEQNMRFCLGLASHATVIDAGQIVYTSSIEELKANDNIRQRWHCKGRRPGRNDGRETVADT